MKTTKQNLITVADAASRLGITPCRVRVLIRSGRVPGAARYGSQWLIPADSLKAVATRLPGRPGWQ